MATTGEVQTRENASKSNCWAKNYNQQHWQQNNQSNEKSFNTHTRQSAYGKESERIAVYACEEI